MGLRGGVGIGIPAGGACAPARPGDVKTAWVSNAHAETVLGWRPTVAFADGFRELMEE